MIEKIKIAVKDFASANDFVVLDNLIQIQVTRKEFDGDFTLVLFPLIKIFGLKLPEIADKIGNYLVEHVDDLTEFNVVKGFLNLSSSDDYWLNALKTFNTDRVSGKPLIKSTGQTFLVEFSSPNTNKPLHLGHLRNNFLGDSVSSILQANGHKVKRVQIINDRGIHICKSIVAWLNYGNGETPDSSGIKGDHLVGKYYVKFDQVYKEQTAELIANGVDEKSAPDKTAIFIEAKNALVKWESKDPEIYSVWQKMNGWVYDGFETTYQKMNISFDKLYYESETYLKGKSEVERGVEQGIFYKKEDGSIWVDLTDEGLDQKLLLRSDGTAVYMTQDIGTAIQRYEDFNNLNGIIYTVGNEQDYHFKVLFLILAKLGYEWAKQCYHLSYGMVDLPSGKMKSREGTVVDADDLMDEMVDTARLTTEELGKVDAVPENEKEGLYNQIGIGALKYFILKVDPKKRMVFNPEESIDFAGNTGPFIQYAHARIQAIVRRAGGTGDLYAKNELNKFEKSLIVKLLEFKTELVEAGKSHSPAVLANYVYDLVKTYNQFYQNNAIFGDNELDQHFRVGVSNLTGIVINESFKLLGIQVPDRM